MSLANEDVLYHPVAEWLKHYLKGKYPRAEVTSHDTHKTDLSVFLRTHQLGHHFGDCSAYEIKVDVVAVIKARSRVSLAFAECKRGPITLRDVGQLLGYSLVARPEFSILISPEGLSARLSSLLMTFGRQDILSYGKGRMIRLAEWNMKRSEVNLATWLPKGSHY